MDCVRPYLSQCQSFRLDTRFDEDINDALITLATIDKPPHLNQFALNSREFSLELDLSSNLSDSIIDTLHPIVTNRFDNIPNFKFANLTHLTLFDYCHNPTQYTGCLEDILQASPQLKSLSLVGARLFSDVTQGTEGGGSWLHAVDLPKLEHLLLGFMGKSRLTFILSHISTPILKEFDVVCPYDLVAGDPVDQSIETLIPFFIQQAQGQEDGQSTITKLRMGYFYGEWSVIELENLLDLFPKLDALELTDCHFAQQALQALLIQSSPITSILTPVRCPSLHRLALENCRRLNIDTLKQVIKLRRDLHEKFFGLVNEIDDLTLKSCKWNGSRFRSRVQRRVESLFHKDSSRLLSH
jgi:hypothetical protein